MTLLEITKKAKEGLHILTNSPVSNVIGVSKTEEGWRATVELVERKSIPDTQDVIGVYEVTLDHDGGITNYLRKRVRRRNDLEEVVE